MNDHDFFPFGAPGSYNLVQGARRGSSGRLAPPTATPNQSVRPTLSITTEEPHLRFACPYHKHSPNEKPKQRSCVYPGFKNIARLKEHLYRHHTQLRCSRCKENFKNDAALEKHHSAILPCTFRECQRDYGDGLDQEQRSRLKKRERTSDTKTEEDKWRNIYQMLFPDEVAVPTPYCQNEHSPDVEDYHRFSRENSDRVLEDKLGAIPNGVWSGSAQQMKKLMRDVQEQLFREFHALQNDDDRSSCTSRASTPISSPSPMTPFPYEEDLSMTADDTGVPIPKRPRTENKTESKQPHSGGIVDRETRLPASAVSYQGAQPPQILVSEHPSCETFMEVNSLAHLNLNDSPGPMHTQSLHDAAYVQDPTSFNGPFMSGHTMPDSQMFDWFNSLGHDGSHFQF